MTTIVLGPLTIDLRHAHGYAPALLLVWRGKRLVWACEAVRC